MEFAKMLKFAYNGCVPTGKGKRAMKKVNVLLPLERYQPLKRLVDQMQDEIDTGLRAPSGPGRRLGVGNIVADIFVHAYDEHHEWIDEWYGQGLETSGESDDERAFEYEKPELPPTDEEPTDDKPKRKKRGGKN